VRQNSRSPFDQNIDGIVLLDKSQGISSNAALQEARRLYRARKAGHAGSLDPLATGMLPLCFGEATKVCDYLLSAQKTYRFTARLGQKTDSGDADGQIIEEASIPALTTEQVSRVFADNIGSQQQIPPMYSALKHDGQRLYELARRGEVIERESREIVIYRLQLLRLSESELEAEVSCSKGTYVRTLAEDLASQLGTLAHLIALRRESVEPFGRQTMHSMSTLANMTEIELQAALLPIDFALTHLSAIELNGEQRIAISQGKSVVMPHEQLTGDVVRLYDLEKKFVGIGVITESGELRPKRLLAS
jgi:tRNA pseudouridine55 synthase